MTSTPSKKNITDRFNPILVRELRQMVRSRWINSAILLYLLAMLGICGQGIVVFIDDNTPDFGLGLFIVLLSATSIAALLTVIVHTALRVSFDRIHEDLAFYSMISPGRQVRGRMACALVLSLLFFSISAPFLSITYHFRGLEPQWFLLIPAAFFVIQIVNLLTLAVFSATRSPVQAICYGTVFLALLYALAVFWLFTSYVFHGVFIRPQGVHLYGFHSFYLREWASFYLFCILATISLVFVPITSYLFARCNLSPMSMNRMKPIRRWFSLVILGITGFCLFETFLFKRLVSLNSYYGDEPSFLAYWMLAVTVILSIMLIMAVCERETWEGRLRRDIPKRIWYRALAFPFYTGSVNALFWVFLWTFYLVVAVFLSLFRPGETSYSRGDQYMDILRTFPLLMYLMLVFNCSITALFFWKKLLHRCMARDMIWTLSLGLLGTIAFGTIFAEFLITNLLNVIILPLIGMNILWFCAIIFLGYPWLRNRFLDFTSLGED